MSDFNGLKAGDKLLAAGRRLGSGWSRSKFSMLEWVELEVTRVTPKYYFLGDKRYVKSLNGLNFGERHYLPGCDGAPLSSNSEDYEKAEYLFRKLSGLMPHITNKLEKMPSLEIAAAFADRVRQLEQEMDDAAENG